MVNSLGQGWPRSGLPREHLELWARRFKIKRGQRLALRFFFLQNAWMITRQLPAFPNSQYFGWILDRRRNSVQPGIGLAWQRVAGLFFRCSKRDEL